MYFFLRAWILSSIFREFASRIRMTHLNIKTYGTNRISVDNLSNRYDRQNQQKRYIQKIQLMAAMGPPGGGRNVITNRLLTKFNVINMTFPSEKQIIRIYGTMLNQQTVDFHTEVKGIGRMIYHSYSHLRIQSNFSFSRYINDCYYNFIWSRCFKNVTNTCQDALYLQFAWHIEGKLFEYKYGFLKK